MENVMQLISSVGFPIAACVGMAWYVKYTTDQHNKEITEALNNNTIALQKLVDKLDDNKCIR